MNIITKKILLILVLSQLLLCNSGYIKAEQHLKEEILRSYPAADKNILNAFFSIDRSALLQDISHADLYKNYTHKIGYGQISSKPLLNIILAQELFIKPGCTILEIGTGSGIQAALLEKLGAHVYSLEISFELMSKAKDRLHASGYQHIEIRQGDGFYGWPDKSMTFDRILVTCAYPYVPKSLVNQLKEGGYLLMPIGYFGKKQQLIRYKKLSGIMKIDKIIRDVEFIPLLNHSATTKIQFKNPSIPPVGVGFKPTPTGGRALTVLNYLVVKVNVADGLPFGTVTPRFLQFFKASE